MLVSALNLIYKFAIRTSLAKSSTSLNLGQ